VNSEQLTEAELREQLSHSAGIVVPGGFGSRGIEGKVLAARYAREEHVPYLGLCYGLHMAAIDVARNVLGLADANSTEIDPATRNPVIDLMPDQKDVEMGGTMRLGAWPCKLVPGTRAAAAYGTDLVTERHRHRYEINNAYRDALEEGGLIISGESPDGRLAEIMELIDHPWFVGVQFHPELKSRPTRPHPLFRDFVAAATKILREGEQRPLPIERSEPREAHSVYD
jgi:CTP synthase